MRFIPKSEFNVTKTTQNSGNTGGGGGTGLKGDKGDTGAAGAKGDTGTQGPAGAKGDTGTQGPAGDKGDKGDTGAAGAKGDTGAAGAKGDAGAAGAKGDAGAAGAKGDTGAAGAKGDTGAAGAKGDTGDTGKTTGFRYKLTTPTYYPYPSYKKIIFDDHNGPTKWSIGYNDYDNNDHTNLIKSLDSHGDATEKGTIILHDESNHKNGGYFKLGSVVYGLASEGILFNVIANSFIKLGTGLTTDNHYFVSFIPKGIQGVPGAAGAAGAQGATGATGPAGPTGAQGAAGAKGDTGAAGAKGDPGSASAAIRLSLGSNMTDITSSSIGIRYDIENHNSGSIFSVTQAGSDIGTYISVSTDVRVLINYGLTINSNSANGDVAHCYIQTARLPLAKWITEPNTCLTIEAPSKTPVYYSSSASCIVELAAGDKLRCIVSATNKNIDVNGGNNGDTFLALIDIKGGEIGPTGAKGDTGASGQSVVGILDNKEKGNLISITFNSRDRNMVYKFDSGVVTVGVTEIH